MVSEPAEERKANKKTTNKHPPQFSSAPGSLRGSYYYQSLQARTARGCADILVLELRVGDRSVPPRFFLPGSNFLLHDRPRDGDLRCRHPLPDFTIFGGLDKVGKLISLPPFSIDPLL